MSGHVTLTFLLGDLFLLLCSSTRINKEVNSTVDLVRAVQRDRDILGHIKRHTETHQETEKWWVMYEDGRRRKRTDFKAPTEATQLKDRVVCRTRHVMPAARTVMRWSKMDVAKGCHRKRLPLPLSTIVWLSQKWDILLTTFISSSRPFLVDRKQRDQISTRVQAFKIEWYIYILRCVFQWVYILKSKNSDTPSWKRGLNWRMQCHRTKNCVRFWKLVIVRIQSRFQTPDQNFSSHSQFGFIPRISVICISSEWKWHCWACNGIARSL